ncbi:MULTISPECIES: tRNA (adenosine(37)-N6)-threonylcarbamoyltransferase complex dimerization subunit type 1 TsaB [unclassified Olleya]|uniref:tRNA (adenosine(37)-N6)-threonylcarbamoyltransferase complex dimerization subunit type 1 TsaB n=1 Tax=unclassified Olleya TaxID=2615019 RepID=UPI0011A33C98|nr:tRNA (adenosine(37)-N6)-threonylcarbamoyltransferase complex dimerization subunit type 1 TsaB [Olleya sp. Hel_I_94]TVZ47612.1 tRNA threonylcarbamoyladenosine biosynthesis protein TsaB [Olleya sp. Hel_I_94]
MAYILNIETSTTNCSVSLSHKGETLVLKEDYGNGYSHAEKLHVYVDEVLKEAKISTLQLDAIAVSKGPGSYTGLRIGVSAAKGLAFALNIPLISVSTLEALAHQVKADSGLIIPMLDARRLEVYSAIFDTQFNSIRAIEAQVLDETSFQSYLSENKVYFIGDGVAKTKALLDNNNAVFIENKLPSADQMSALSFNKYKKSDTEDVAYFEPYYLKDFVAIKSKK